MKQWSKGRNIIGYKYLYKTGPEFQMQLIGRIKVRITLRRTSVDTIRWYGLDCSGLNLFQMADILNKLWLQNQNDNSLSSS